MNESLCSNSTGSNSIVIWARAMETSVTFMFHKIRKNFEILMFVCIQKDHKQGMSLELVIYTLFCQMTSGTENEWRTARTMSKPSTIELCGGEALFFMSFEIFKHKNLIRSRGFILNQFMLHASACERIDFAK